MGTKKSAYNLDIYKASVCLLCLFFICFLSLQSSRIEAKNIREISITEETASPSRASIGQEIKFSAKYSTSTTSEGYALHICKSKKISSDQSCQDGSWCDSNAFATDNPLLCQFTSSEEEIGNNDYFMFVCDKEKKCSAPKSGAFTIIRNTLSIEAPATLAFKSIPFSFSSQKSVGNALGDLILSYASTSNPGWSLDVTAADWQDTTDGDSMDFDGDGTATGQLTADLSAITIESPDPINNIRTGNTASFSTSLKTINIATARKKNGNGTFIIKNIRFDQFVPGNQKEGEYKTVLTFTIS